MKKLALGVIITFAILVGGFYLLNSYIYRAKQATEQTYEPYRGTLTGEYTCLPTIDGSQNEDCIEGIKTDVGEYYAVDFLLMSQIPAEPLTIGDRFQATGLITPIQRLSTNAWDIYPIEGIFSVTDSVEGM